MNYQRFIIPVLFVLLVSGFFTLFFTFRISPAPTPTPSVYGVPKMVNMDANKDFYAYNDIITLSWHVKDAKQVIVTPENERTLVSISDDGIGTGTIDLAQVCDGDGNFNFKVLAIGLNNKAFAMPDFTVMAQTYSWFFSLDDGSKPRQQACAPSSFSQAVVQEFEGGEMLRLADEDEIYVMYYEDESGLQLLSRYRHEDFMVNSDPSIVPPTGMEQPRDDFGKIWLGEPQVREKLGWALAGERPFIAEYQSFNQVNGTRESGVMYVSHIDGSAVWELVNTGALMFTNRWKALPATIDN